MKGIYYVLQPSLEAKSFDGFQAVRGPYSCSLLQRINLGLVTEAFTGVIYFSWTVISDEC